METIVTPKTEQDIVVLTTENGEEFAFLDDATLVEDITLVRDFAKAHNIPYYKAIKKEADGHKNYVLDDNGLPTIVEDGVLGVNKDYVAPVVEVVDLDKVEEPTENVDLVSETAVVEPVVETTEETPIVEENESVDTKELSEEEIAERNAKLEEYAELKSIIATKDVQIEDLKSKLVDKDMEICGLKDQIETLSLNNVEEVNVDKCENFVIGFDDVIEFMKEHGLTSLSIKGE